MFLASWTRLAASTTNTAGLIAVSHHGKPGLKSDSSSKKEKQIPVIGKQTITMDSNRPAKVYIKKDLFVIHGAATVKTSDMISSIFKHRC